MKLLPPHKTSRTSMGQTLRSILADVLLCMGSAKVLAIGYQPEDTCCQCCFVLTSKICFVEVVVAAAIAAEAPTLRAHVLADEGVLLLAVAPPKLLFLVRSIVG
jgi:hypothetical protein